MYLTLKNYPKILDKYQLISISTVYHYVKIKFILLDKHVDYKNLKDKLIYYTDRTYNLKELDNLIKYQEKFLM